MRAMNFRLKLLLAMMLVVAGATGTALYVSQQRVQATYQKLFAQLSHAKIESFTSLQETRLGALKDKSRELAQSVRLQAALHESDENDATNLYLVAKDELRELSDNTIYVFFDSQGRLLVPTQNDSRFNRFGGQGQFRKQFSFVGESLTNNLPQQV